MNKLAIWREMAYQKIVFQRQWCSGVLFLSFLISPSALSGDERKRVVHWGKDWFLLFPFVGLYTPEIQVEGMEIDTAFFLY
jgi:hypothetical protein